MDMAEVAQRSAARDKATLDSLAGADRQTRWSEERGRILRERAKLRKAAEEGDGTTGYL